MFATQDDGSILGTSDALHLVIDGSTGGISKIENAATNQVLLEAESPLPWRLTPLGRTDALFGARPRPSFAFSSITPSGFQATVTDDAVHLRWSTTDPGIGVEADLSFDEGGSLEMRARVRVDDGTEPPADLTYPILSGIRALSHADDVLVFPAHSGWLIRRPLGRPFPVSGPYPDGYQGCSMQFMAYFADGAGGFYLATHDPHSTAKTFSFSSEASITHDNWDLRAGTTMDLDYPVVIAALRRGDWYEASEIYRRWVTTNAPWYTGPRRDRDGGRWLRDEVTCSIWCTPSVPDWSRWYRFYADELGSPLHIVAGWEWPATRPHTVGKEGWFPARFHPNNVEAWRGHHVTPYMNDWFISPAAEGFIDRWEPELVMPHRFFTFSVFTAPASGQLQDAYPTTDPRVVTDNPFYLCPSSAAQRELHAWRDMRLVRDHGCDGSFYDISSGNPLLFSRCLRRDHDHPPGRGRHLISALEDVNRASKDLVREQTGRYLVQGVETIIENIAASMDFYVSRAAGGPMGFLETDTQGPEEPPGVGRELIPLFQSVYHDIGPVHEDGWIRLVEEEGELFYWVAARIYIQWGGLMSIHFPITPPERPPGHDGGAEAFGWGGQHQTFTELGELDRNKSAFLAELGRARTTFANAYLGYGRMTRPPTFRNASIDLFFDQELPGSKVFRNTGTWTVPQVTCGAWIDDRENSLGLVFVNLHALHDAEIALDTDIEQTWGMALRGDVRVVTADAVSERGGSDGRLAVTVALPPRKVVVVEVS